MFNTAVFYDVENLLKGYSFSQQLISNLSLTDILGAVADTGHTEGFALQRAYANWSDARLAVMRGEINELGIDPIQVFGFNRDVKKNAADIQLAIDAIDVAHSRPGLQVFVIVSGDGGFAALAKKLHEYGKIVIGCAYRKQTNRVFQAVCDEFIWLEDPEEKTDNGESGQTPDAPGTGFSQLKHGVNREIFSQIQRLTGFSRESVIQKTREVLNCYAQHPTTRQKLSVEGIELPMVRDALQYAIPSFEQTKLGYQKFGDYLQMVCHDTEFCVAHLPQKPAALILRSHLQGDWESLPGGETHTLETYRRILASGNPTLRLPPPAELLVLLRWLAYEGASEDLGSMIERATQDCPQLSATQIKYGVLSLVSIYAFDRHPNGVPLSEQTLSLKDTYHSPAAMLRVLREQAKTKLERGLTVDMALFNQLLPESMAG